ncbi:TIGR04149 family rSAM-modified RiPP [Bacteroides gallinaceum]|uniref:TIGR04149 family rSAM-modified RiPP n=2 Tax=Bacteroidaceae TaxID=815 RepID=A0ABT7VHD7_9BACE|nr:TIGR04149 family rSAM-modified RiPP [Bacteroides gallinaceum]MBU3856545.1 TIGR04149 family rSAM-modified RiPP [Candidatus Phocaeicola excrementipullorum]MDM8325719.1 TIGR04149 family rSAM-modified RiPP [Bacteroides gallinaceum]
MKKLGTLKLKNASVLSEKEMKGIFGGSGDVSCTVSLNCAGGSVSCTSSIGDCERISQNISGFNIVTEIRCEDKVYSCSSENIDSGFSF